MSWACGVKVQYFALDEVRSEHLGGGWEPLQERQVGIFLVAVPFALKEWEKETRLTVCDFGLIALIKKCHSDSLPPSRFDVNLGGRLF